MVGSGREEEEKREGGGRWLLSLSLSLSQSFLTVARDVTRRVDCCCFASRARRSRSFHLLPERARLNKVGLGDSREVGDGRTGELLVVLGELVGVLLVGERLDRRRVVGAIALVLVSHRTVALEVGDGVDQRVHRKRSVVGSEAMAEEKGCPQSERLRQ
jgi:hypothetical protein